MTSPLASLLPPPRAVFYYPASGNGQAGMQPLAGGFVYTYVPGGTTPKTTWQDAGETTPNTNPIVLDAAGSCLLYGSGQYQITVTDPLGNAVPGYSGLTVDSLSLLASGSSGVIATIAALRAATTSALPQTQVYVQGYYTTNDDGQGTFLVGPNAADNGGTVINDASGRSWYRDTQGLDYSVKWFGAKGDGATNDVTSFQLCDTAAAAAGVGVYLPGSPTAYIFDPVALTNEGCVSGSAHFWHGAGKSASVIAAQNGGVWSNTASCLLQFSSVTDLVINGIGFDMTNASLTAGTGSPGNLYFHVALINCNNPLIEDNAFTGIQGHNLALATNGGSNITIIKNYFNMPNPAIGTTQDSAAINISNTSGTVGPYTITDNVLEGTQIFSVASDGYIAGNYISGWGQGGGICCGPAVTCQRQIIVDNKIQNSQKQLDLNGVILCGIENWSSYTIISGNFCGGCGGHGIQSAGLNVMLDGNVCLDNGQFPGTGGNITSGICLTQGGGTPPVYFSSDCVISDNVCCDFQTTPTQQYGIIESTPTPGYYTANNGFYDNYMTGNAVAPILLAGSPVFFRGPQIAVSYFAVGAFTVANGASYNFTVSVPDAKLGDIAKVAHNQNILGLVATAYVSAANTVIAVFSNLTGASVTIGAGALNVLVEKPSNYTA